MQESQPCLSIEYFPLTTSSHTSLHRPPTFLRPSPPHLPRHIRDDDGGPIRSEASLHQRQAVGPAAPARERVMREEAACKHVALGRAIRWEGRWFCCACSQRDGAVWEARGKSAEVRPSTPQVFMAPPPPHTHTTRGPPPPARPTTPSGRRSRRTWLSRGPTGGPPPHVRGRCGRTAAGDGGGHCGRPTCGCCCH